MGRNYREKLNYNYSYIFPISPLYLPYISQGDLALPHELLPLHRRQVRWLGLGLRLGLGLGLRLGLGLGLGLALTLTLTLSLTLTLALTLAPILTLILPLTGSDVGAQIRNAAHPSAPA